MALLEHNTFVKNDLLPSWWANAIQKFLSTGAPSFQVTKQDATHIQVTAAAADGAAVIAIAGKWRWIEATINRAHPGGAAGTWDIYVVAAANKIAGGGVDETNYAYELRILESGKTPTIEAGVVDIFRKVGSLEWSGTEITRVDQTVNATPTHAHRHATGQPDAISPASIGAATTAEALAAMETYEDQTGFWGVYSSFDWLFTATINAATGVIGSTGTTGGRCRIPGAPTKRTVTPVAALAGLVPPSLPVSGKFMSIGVQLAAGTFGGPATVSLVSGVEKATEAEALAAPAAVVGQRVRVKDIIVKNTAGVFSIVAERDRRPWAEGARWVSRSLSTASITTTAPTLLFPAVRLELLAAEMFVRLTIVAETATASEVLTFGLYRNGTLIPGSEWQVVMPAVTGVKTVISYSKAIAAAQGSNLLELKANIGVESAGHKVTLLSEQNPVWELREIELGWSSFNNGTS